MAVIMAVIVVNEVAVVIIIAKQKISYKKRLEKKKPCGVLTIDGCGCGKCCSCC